MKDGKISLSIKAVEEVALEETPAELEEAPATYSFGELPSATLGDLLSKIKL